MLFIISCKWIVKHILYFYSEELPKKMIKLWKAVMFKLKGSVKPEFTSLNFLNSYVQIQQSIWLLFHSRYNMSHEIDLWLHNHFKMFHIDLAENNQWFKITRDNTVSYNTFIIHGIIQNTESAWIPPTISFSIRWSEFFVLLLSWLHDPPTIVALKKLL